MIESQISEAGIATTLSRVPPADETAGATTADLLAAIDDLTRGWVVPLAVELNVECCDPSTWMPSSTIEPTHGLWFLRVPTVPVGVDVAPTRRGMLEQVEAELDHATIARWVGAAESQPCGNGHVAVLTEIQWTAVRARVPVDGPFVVKDGHDQLDTYVEENDGVRWAFGPLESLVPSPVWLRAPVWGGAPRISLAPRWYLWVDHPALVDAGVARVLARPGWKLYV